MSTFNASSFQNKINALEQRLIAENKSRDRDRGRTTFDQPPRRPRPCKISMFLWRIYYGKQDTRDTENMESETKCQT